MADKRNVLIVSTSGNRGGMENHILNILEGLYKDFDFYVVCPKGNIVSEYKKYAKVIDLSPRFDIDPIYILKLVRIFKVFNISVVHTHELKAVVNGLTAASIAKVPLKISHQHTPISNWQINVLKKKIDVLIYKTVVNKLSTFEIALTSEIKEQKLCEGISKRKLVVIPNGVDLAKFKLSVRKKEDGRKRICEKYGISASGLIVGTISRLTAEKGHALLIKAVRALENNNNASNVQFIIAGAGKLKDMLVRMVKSYGLSDKVSFTGFVSEEEKLMVLSSLDVFVFPTKAEGFGIVLIEAMASGLPCVVADLPVLKEIADDSVLYFAQGDEGSLKVSLEKAILDAKLRVELSKKALERVKLYKIEKFWDYYKRLYKI